MVLRMYPRTRSYPYHLNTAKSWNDLNYFTVTIWRQTLWFIHRICKNLKIRFSRNSESYGKFYNSKFCVFFVFFFQKKVQGNMTYTQTHTWKNNQEGGGISLGWMCGNGGKTME